MKSLFALVFLASIASASVAQAQQDLSGTLHLALEGALLEYRALTFEPESVRGVRVEEYDIDQMRVGLPTGAAARVGYLPKNNLEFGGLLQFDRRSTEYENSENSEHELLLAAYFRYVVPGNRVRFFVGPQLGMLFAGNRSKADGDQFDEDYEAETSGRLFAIGADAGLYGFLLGGLSIDPTLSFKYVTGSFEQEDDDVPVDLEEDVSGFQVSLGFALSGWIGLR